MPYLVNWSKKERKATATVTRILEHKESVTKLTMDGWIGGRQIRRILLYVHLLINKRK